MAAFDYVALDPKGREKKGVTEGDTPRQVRQILRDKDLIPLQITAARSQKKAANETKGEKRPAFSLQRGISATELALITRQLATLVQSGMPLEESLAAVANQSEKQRTTSMMFAIRSRVLEGHTLAAGLGEFPRVFPELYIATVAAGEASGFLDTVLERLADYTETRQVMQQNIQKALMYPIILTVIAFAIVAFLMTYVVPQVVEVFDNIDQELPGLTIGMIAISDFLRDWWPAIIVALVAVSMGWAKMLTIPRYRVRYHRFLLRLPLIKALVRGVNTALFARTLSILISSGVSVLDSMHIAAQVVTNLPMRDAITDASDRVREGSSIYAALDKSHLFPPMTLSLINSGEASGRLDDMLERAAVQQEREQEVRIAYIMGLFEPVMLLVMAGAVLTIILAVMLPILNLNQLVG